jgi:hypothetical protein
VNQTTLLITALPHYRITTLSHYRITTLSHYQIMKEAVINQYHADAVQILQRHTTIMNHKKKHRIPPTAWKRQMECRAKKLWSDFDRLLGSYAEAGYNSGVKMMELARITRPMHAQFRVEYKHQSSATI